MLHPAITAAYKYASPGRTLNVIVLSDGMTVYRTTPIEPSRFPVLTVKTE